MTVTEKRKREVIERMNKNVSKKIDLFSTIEYNQFKSIKGNRAVSPPHVRSIIESITEHNYLFEFPISVTNDLEVIDGQHRLEAAKQLGKMIWYRKIDIKGDTAIRDIQLINTAVKGWITTDYLKSYIARGFSEYERLWDFAQRYKYSIATSASLLMGYSTTKKEVYQTFRSGRFKITHEDKATEYVEYVEKIMPFLQENLYQHREFIKAMKIGRAHV